MVSVRPTPDSLLVWQQLLGYVRRSTTQLDADLRAERGIALDDYDVLFQVSQGPRAGLRMSTLADSLLVAPSSCTRLVGRLVGQGWLTRRFDPADGRAVVVALTPAGRSTLARAAVVHLRGLEHVFASRLSASQLRSLADALRALDQPSGRYV